MAGAASGRIERGTLENGLLSASLTNFDEQSSHWLLYSALTARAGRRLALDNQILLGGDNGLRGYPLRLFRVGAAVFFDMGRTWGRPPLAAPGLGLLEDAGFGLRLGNARTAFGNVIHVDLAFPFDAGSSIKQVQFLVTTHRNF